MRSDLSSILSLEVPVIVVLGERAMKTADVVSLIPGSIIELPKNVEEELTLLVNNRTIGTGVAVKVGENFGLRVSYTGDLRDRIAALGDSAQAGRAAGADDQAFASPDAMAAAKN